MRLHRFYTPFYDFIKAARGMRLVLSLENSEEHKTDYKALIHQWRSVFNYTAGSQVLLFDGRGGEVLAIVEDISWSEVSLVVIEQRKGRKNFDEDDGAVGTDKVELAELEAGTLPGGAWLFASIIKGDNFDWIIQKTTELGVDHIVPVISDRTIKKNINPERSKKIAVEAAEQCGRATVPVIHKPIKLEDALEKFTKAGGVLYICAAGGKNFSEIKFKDAKESNKGKKGTEVQSTVGFVVGPEGGWSDREEMYFKRQKFTQISLGENVLRAETAAVAVMALAMIAK